MLTFFLLFFFFFFNDTATTEIYTLSLHDALPISPRMSSTSRRDSGVGLAPLPTKPVTPGVLRTTSPRSEEHTSELQSRPHLVCRLLLEKKKKNRTHSSKATVIGSERCRRPRQRAS